MEEMIKYNTNEVKNIKTRNFKANNDHEMGGNNK